MKIFFYAFANTPYIFNEVIKLSQKKKHDIEWGMIYPRAVYKDTYPSVVDKNNVLYLYENFNKIYSEISEKDISFNDEKWVDNIHTILESSKFGYKVEKSEKQLKVVYTIYQIYKEFLIKSEPNYIVFPDIETVNGVLLLNICRELDIETMVTAHARQFSVSFFSPDYKETLPTYIGNYNDNDKKQAELFLDKKIEKAIIGNAREKQRIEICPITNIFGRFINSIKTYFKYESKGVFDTNLYLRIRLNFEKYFELWREWFFNNYQIRFFHIKTEQDFIPENYIVFLLQVTPESSINTFERFFIEQERVIDLVRLNMPSNMMLLVKEHPAMRGMRSSRWYKKMHHKSGVQLVTHRVDTQLMVKNSKLVITVTGSVGIECYHMDKSVLMFGKNFISHFVDNVDSFTLLKKHIAELIYKKKFDSYEEKKIKIAQLYNVGYDFFIHEPFHFSKVMEVSNIEIFLEAILNHIERNSKNV